MAPKRRLRLAVTTGDPDGIGLEVSVKALNVLGPKAGVQFILFRAAGARPRYRNFAVVRVKSLDEALATAFSSRTLIEVISDKSAATWVEVAAEACMLEHLDGMVTAPLSKTSIIAAGLQDIGHTEILARISGRRDLFMGFIGREFNVVLASGHRSLAEAVTTFDAARLKRALGAAAQLRQILPPKRRARPMALVGLNPHAGEAGLIGREEAWMRKFTSRDLEGPLVPDAAFLPKFWSRYSVYITPYHDQGLIPFKLVHGFTGGVHLTLGLPFVRTSVDHGTAKDLFGLNRAESGSMRDALKAAIELARTETTR